MIRADDKATGRNSQRHPGTDRQSGWGYARPLNRRLWPGCRGNCRRAEKSGTARLMRPGVLGLLDGDAGEWLFARRLRAMAPGQPGCTDTTYEVLVYAQSTLHGAGANRLRGTAAAVCRSRPGTTGAPSWPRIRNRLRRRSPGRGVMRLKRKQTMCPCTALHCTALHGTALHCNQGNAHETRIAVLLRRLQCVNGLVVGRDKTRQYYGVLCL